jgi:hypothetical protein
LKNFITHYDNQNVDFSLFLEKNDLKNKLLLVLEEKLKQ